MNMLAKCIDEIHSGPWHFIQLRDTLLSADDIDGGGDVDLLGSLESIHSLLDRCYQWVQKGWCHVQIRSRKFGQKLVTLYSFDGKQCLVLDLWYSLPQLVGTKSRLTYAALSDKITQHEKGQSISRFPVDLEACIYLHHAAAKKKDLQMDHQQKRLNDFLGRCSDPVVIKCLQDVVANNSVGKNITEKTLEIILSHMDQSCEPHSSKMFLEHLQVHPRKNFVCIMGCDGVGKTTLSKLLARRLKPHSKSFRSKRLYRKSLIYNVLWYLQKSKFANREHFEEHYAFFVYLRASMSLAFKRFVKRRKLQLCDRNLVDFLYLDRKTDNPVWSRHLRLASLVGKRIPTIHCVASYEVISSRKQELTVKGHEKYDKDMFEYFSRRNPTEYLLFNNTSSLEESCDALQRLIFSQPYPIGKQFKHRSS